MCVPCWQAHVDCSPWGCLFEDPSVWGVCVCLCMHAHVKLCVRVHTCSSTPWGKQTEYCKLQSSAFVQNCDIKSQISHNVKNEDPQILPKTPFRQRGNMLSQRVFTWFPCMHLNSPQSRKAGRCLTPWGCCRVGCGLLPWFGMVDAALSPGQLPWVT